MSTKVRIAFFASGSGSNVENIVTKLSNETTIEFVKIYCNKPDAFVLQRAEKLQIPARVFTKQEFSLSDIILQDLLAEKTFELEISEITKAITDNAYETAKKEKELQKLKNVQDKIH